MRDFDDMVRLYQEDPETFEAEAKEAVESYISSVPEECQQRLRQLQWKIDNELRKFKDPIARMNHMIEIFYSMVQEGAQKTIECCEEIQLRLADEYIEPEPEAALPVPDNVTPLIREK